MAGAASRLVALDVLRGAAVAGMVLVNSPGDWGHVYAPLLHADWDGWTVTDMVFPTFLFSVGCALGLSFPKDLRSAAARRAFWWRVARRVAALVLLGLCLEATYNLAVYLAGSRWTGPGGSGLEHLRIPGILQRIGLCYGLAVMIVVATASRDAERRVRVDMRAVGLAIAALLLGYWAVMTLVPVPGYGAGRLDPEGNLAAWIDRAVFTPGHLWPLGWASAGGPAVYDPEGLLSGLPATANVLFGVLATTMWRRDPARAPAIVTVAGAGMFVAGLLIDPLFAINKRIWTSSFALLSSGFSAVLLGVLGMVLHHPIADRLTGPLRVLGGNAILAFVVSTLLGRVLGFPFAGGTATVWPQVWINGQVLNVVPDPKLASLICAVATVAVVTLIVWPFHRRGIHFRL